jgi:hypothetical protein
MYEFSPEAADGRSFGGGGGGGWGPGGRGRGQAVNLLIYAVILCVISGGKISLIPCCLDL